MPARHATHKPPWRAPALVAQREARRKQLVDASRPPSSKRGYDAEWRALRDRYLSYNPHCSVEDCKRRADTVDHVKTIRSHPELRLEWSNLRSLCRRHHDRITAVTQGFAVPGRAR